MHGYTYTYKHTENWTHYQHNSFGERDAKKMEVSLANTEAKAESTVVGITRRFSRQKLQNRRLLTVTQPLECMILRTEHCGAEFS